MSTSGTLLDFLQAWSGWGCHHIPERVPHSGTEMFPVCFRCAGWQLGLFASYVRMIAGNDWRGHFPSLRIALTCVGLMAPLLVDGIGNTLHLWDSPDWLRGLTGLGVGLCIPWLLAPLAYDASQTENPTLKSLRPLLWPALTGMAAVGILHYGTTSVVFRLIAVATTTGWTLFISHLLFALVRSYGNPVLQSLRQLLSSPEARS